MVFLLGQYVAPYPVIKQLFFADFHADWNRLLSPAFSVLKLVVSRSNARVGSIKVVLYKRCD